MALRSLRSQLLLTFFVISIVPLTIALAVGYVSTRWMLEKELEKSLRSIAARQSAQLNSNIRSRMQEVELLAQSPIIFDALRVEAPSADTMARLDAYTKPQVEMRKYANLFLITRDGNIVYTANPTPERNTSIRKQYQQSELTRVVERALTILETEFSDFKIHPPTGRPAAFLATPVLSGGKVLGVLALEMGPSTALIGVNDYTGLGATGETLVAVIDGTDALLVSPTRNDPDAGFKQRLNLDDPNAALLRNALEGGRDSGMGIDQNGTRVYATWRYLPAMRWGIVVKINHAEAFASVKQLAILFTVLLTLVTGIVLAVALITARALVKPLHSLGDATRRVAEGEFSTPINVSSNLEIENLAQDFRNMIAHLNQTFTELKRTTEECEKAAQEALAYAEEAKQAKQAVEEINRTLEQKVAARTSELTQKNQSLELAMANLQRTQQQLIAQEKMASLGQLTSGIAHEISNPLNFVNNFSEASVDLLTDLEAVGHRSAPLITATDRQELEELLPLLAENMSRIREHGRRAESIVKGMLEHSRSTGSARSPIQLNQALRDSLRTCHQSLKTRQPDLEVSTALHLDDSIGEVSVFGFEFSRAINNLIYNALWAANERRKTVDANFQPLVELTSEAKDGKIIVRVRDNGIGISAENKAKIFQPFFTTKPTGQGVGLGLSLAWQILVDQHGAKLEFTSEPGEHTEFSLTLKQGRGVELKFNNTEDQRGH